MGTTLTWVKATAAGALCTGAGSEEGAVDAREAASMEPLRRTVPRVTTVTVFIRELLAAIQTIIQATTGSLNLERLGGEGKAECLQDDCFSGRLRLQQSVDSVDPRDCPRHSLSRLEPTLELDI
jgi:hypothetical protein